MYLIDKCIPIPPKVKENKSKYPYATMEIGDSFSFAHNQKINVLSAAYGYQRKQENRWDFEYRKIVSNQYRIWRTK